MRHDRCPCQTAAARQVCLCRRRALARDRAYWVVRSSRTTTTAG